MKSIYDLSPLERVTLIKSTRERVREIFARQGLGSLSPLELPFEASGTNKLVYKVAANQLKLLDKPVGDILVVAAPYDEDYALREEAEKMVALNDAFDDKFSPLFQEFVEGGELDLLLMSYLPHPHLGEVSTQDTECRHTPELAYNLGKAIGHIHKKTGWLHTDPLNENIKVDGDNIRFIDVISFEEVPANAICRQYLRRPEECAGDDAWRYPMDFGGRNVDYFLNGLNYHLNLDGVDCSHYSNGKLVSLPEGTRSFGFPRPRDINDYHERFTENN